MNLANAGTGRGDTAAFQGADDGQELLATECAGAAEDGLTAGFDQPRHAADVIVVPVARHDQGDGPGRIDADAFQVAQRSRRAVRIQAGVDEDPDAAADVEDDALAVAGAEKRELEFVFWWWRFRVRHGSND